MRPEGPTGTWPDGLGSLLIPNAYCNLWDGITLARGVKADLPRPKASGPPTSTSGIATPGSDRPAVQTLRWAIGPKVYWIRMCS